MINESEEAKQLYNRQFKEYYKKQTEYKVIQDLRKKVYAIIGNIRNKEILFVGCGDGSECIPAVKRSAKVVGIDISEKAIELAKRNCPKSKFYVMDFEKTNFKKNSFDIIVSILSIMYKKNLDLVLREFRRILKENGFIILVAPHPVRKMIKYSNMNYFVKGKIWEIWRGIKRFNYYRLFEDYFDSIDSSKLKVVKLLEPKPIKETRKTPNSEINHPHFLIFKLRRD